MAEQKAQEREDEGLSEEEGSDPQTNSIPTSQPGTSEPVDPNAGSKGSGRLKGSHSKKRIIGKKSRSL
jgi:hypothetical protein